MTFFSWAMNLNNALGRYVYLQHCNVSWHPANTWKESNFRREEVTSPIIIFKAPVSLILWSYQRFICYHKAKKNWGVGFLQGMPAHISLNVTLKHRPMSLDSRYCTDFVSRIWFYAFLITSQNSRWFSCFALLNLVHLFIYICPVLPNCKLPSITFETFMLLHIFASTVSSHFLSENNSRTLSQTSWFSDCCSCNNPPTLRFLNPVTKSCYFPVTKPYIDNRHEVWSQ